MWTVQTKVNCHPREGEPSSKRKRTVIHTKANRHPNEGEPSLKRRRTSPKRRRTIIQTKVNCHPNEGDQKYGKRTNISVSVGQPSSRRSLHSSDEGSTVIPMKSGLSSRWRPRHHPHDCWDAILQTTTVSRVVHRECVEFRETSSQSIPYSPTQS